jgi:hypothetical protein
MQVHKKLFLLQTSLYSAYLFSLPFAVCSVQEAAVTIGASVPKLNNVFSICTNHQETRISN